MIGELVEIARFLHIHLRRSDGEAVVVDLEAFVFLDQHGSDGVAYHLTEFDEPDLDLAVDRRSGVVRCDDEDGDGVVVAFLVAVFVGLRGESLRLDDEVRDFVLLLIFLRPGDGEDACTFEVFAFAFAFAAKDLQQVGVGPQGGYECFADL